MPAVPWLVEGVGVTNRDAVTAAVDWAAGRATMQSLGADAVVQLTVVTECLAAEELLSLATPCPASLHPLVLPDGRIRPHRTGAWNQNRIGERAS